MDSPLLKFVKSKCPDNEYPSSTGQKWSLTEEKLLLDQLDKNIDINIIAQTHNRTVGGIIGRQQVLAYKMYLHNMSIEEIILKSRLNIEQITETITKKEQKNKQARTKYPTATSEPKKFSLETEVMEMRIEIKELKNRINELVEMMKAVYEFKDDT